MRKPKALFKAKIDDFIANHSKNGANSIAVYQRPVEVDVAATDDFSRLLEIA